MKSFALACLMSASVSAVSLESYAHPWADNGEIEEALNDGDLVPVDAVDDKLIVLSKPADEECGEDCAEEEVCAEGECCDEDCVEEEACGEDECCGEEGCKESVTKQVEAGFDKIQLDNDMTEKIAVKLTQEAQKLEIDEIIADANDAAKTAIEVADTTDAVEIVAEIYKDEVEDIAATNTKHDEQISAIAKESVVSQISNEAVKTNIVADIAAAVDDEEVIGDIVKNANLPFSVDTGAAVIKDGAELDNGEIAVDTLEQIVDESGTDVKDIKKNPKIDGFLEQIMINYDELVSAPAKPQAPEALDFQIDTDLIAKP